MVQTTLSRNGYKIKKNELSQKELKDIQLVIVSPCQRTLDTETFIFQHINAPTIAKDFLIEYPIGGNEICNKRKDISDLKYMYPYIQFEDFPNKANWSNKRETKIELNNRIGELLDWIGTRRETKIAIISHSSFIGQMKDGIIGDENHELKHCHPYKLEAKYSHEKKFISMKEIKE